MGRACWWLTPLYELVLGTVLSTDKVFACVLDVQRDPIRVSATALTSHRFSSILIDRGIGFQY